MQLAIFIAAALLVASASAVTYPGLTTCTTKYTTNLASASSFDQRCAALAAYDQCIVTLVAGSIDYDMITAAETALASAFSSASTCSTSLMANFRPYMAIENSAIEFHVGQGKDVSFFRLEREAVSVSDVAASLSTLQAAQNTLSNLLANAVETVENQTSISLNTADTDFTNRINTLTAPASTAISTATAQANSVQAVVNSAQSSITASRTSMLSSINGEYQALITLQGSTQNAIAQQQMNLQLGLAADAVDRMNIMSEDNAIVSDIQVTVNNAVTAFSATEASRAVTEATSLSTTVSSLIAMNAADISTAVATEGSRATVAATSLIAAVVPRPAYDSTGNNDDKSCLTSQEGSLYYSGVAKGWYVCNGNYWAFISPIFRAFGTSSVLSSAQDQLLLQAIGYGKWTMCWSGNVHGWSSSTFHSNCDRKGAMVVIGLSSNGYVSGGYIDKSFISRAQYIPSLNTFLWRFNGNTLQQVYPIQYPWYASYDNSGYGPTFGGGHDWYLDGSARTGYTSQHSYWATSSIGYSSSWLLGSANGWTMQKLEVWYRNN